MQSNPILENLDFYLKLSQTSILNYLKTQTILHNYLGLIYVTILGYDSYLQLPQDNYLVVDIAASSRVGDLFGFKQITWAIGLIGWGRDPDAI